jgi:ribose transport system substrate-binding protein
MYRRDKKLWLVVTSLLTILAFLIASCSPQAPAPSQAEVPAQPEQKQYVIGLSNFSLGNSWRVQMVEEAKYAASKNPLVKELIVTEADDSVEKQISDIDDLIAKKVDAILITASNPQALVPVAEKAMAAGIVVVDFDNLVDTDKITAHVKVDQQEFGRVQGEWLVGKMGGSGDIIAFNGMEGTFISAERFAGAKSVFDQYPDINIVQTVAADWDYAKAKRAMESLMTAYPSIDGVWSQGGAMSEAVVEAYLEKNMEPPPVTGEDGNGFLKIWKEVRDAGEYPDFDSIATSMPTWCSAKALEVALAALTGQPFEKETWIPIPTITGETLDQYVKPDLPDSYWCNSQLPEEIVKEVFTR